MNPDIKYILETLNERLTIYDIEIKGIDSFDRYGHGEALIIYKPRLSHYNYLTNKIIKYILNEAQPIKATNIIKSLDHLKVTDEIVIYFNEIYHNIFINNLTSMINESGYNDKVFLHNFKKNLKSELRLDNITEELKNIIIVEIEKHLKPNESYKDYNNNEMLREAIKLKIKET